jgi:MoxR-like ATPase
MGHVVTIGSQQIELADPTPVPAITRFVGRQRELQLCRAAWGISEDGTRLLSDAAPLHFRLEGSPGCGKNEIVYELARHLRLPLYTIQGHEEVTPEDLSLLLVPQIGSSSAGNVPLTLRASPLATALLTGGLFFFDEINRVPPRALSPLASVLDSRSSIYSAMTGLHLTALSTEAAAGFRFCCALNPQLSDPGRGVLPEYIEERTLPAIQVDYLPLSDLNQILRENLPVSNDDMEAWEAWFRRKSGRRLSVRHALTIMRYSRSLQAARGSLTMREALGESEPLMLRPDEQARDDAAANGRDGDEPGSTRDIPDNED